MTRARETLFASFVLASASCGGQTTSLPPYGEALVVVDTDLPVPQLASRLRVDLFGEDGTWIESRDIGRSDPRDWPASFSVYSDDERAEKRVLVRVRAYPEGITRDYRGERFAPRPVFRDTEVPATLADLCARAPELPIGGRVTLRSGGEAMTEIIEQGRCKKPTRAGSVAARVTIATRGIYRFDVADVAPYNTAVTLFLRSRCDDMESQIACQAEPGAGLLDVGHLPRFDATLDPGTYFLMTGGLIPGAPADVTLEVLPVDAPLELAPSAAPAETPPSTPRLLRKSGERVEDATPASEPLPSATVDRLFSVRLRPGVRGRASVVLRGACAGTMAELGIDAHRPDLSTAQTCVDRENVRVPVEEVPLEPDMTRPTSSLRGTFGPNEPCPAQDPKSSAVCVPGGVFLMGSRVLSSGTATLQDSAPERIAEVSRFWMDRYEVTVGRFRAAVDKGLPIDAYSVLTHDQPLTPEGQDGYCTWMTKPGGGKNQPANREDYAMTCIAWRTARAFCQSVGGDLPTEAQWEYAATAAGRPFKTVYPWGNEDPDCDRAVFSRAPRSASTNSNECATSFTGPLAVNARDGADVTPLGIIGLAGGVAELVRDAGASYASDCWQAASLRDPTCWQREAPYRARRGGSWIDVARTATFRVGVLPGVEPNSEGGPGLLPTTPGTGFRCVYAVPRP